MDREIGIEQRKDAVVCRGHVRRHRAMEGRGSVLRDRKVGTEQWKDEAVYRGTGK